MRTCIMLSWPLVIGSLLLLQSHVTEEIKWMNEDVFLAGCIGEVCLTPQ